MLACCLLYSKIYTDSIDALKHFAIRRSSIEKGVIQASQIRYISKNKYFDLFFRYTKYFGDIINRRVNLSIFFKKLYVIFCYFLDRFS